MLESLIEQGEREKKRRRWKLSLAAAVAAAVAYSALVYFGVLSGPEWLVKLLQTIG